MVNYIQANGIITNQNIMAEKVFLDRVRAMPKAETSPCNRTGIPYTSRNIPVAEQLHFWILDETAKSFPKFNASWRSLLIKFNSPGEEQTLLPI